jgi:hypothetical protein
MRFLRFNTATRLSVGPFYDKTDGITPEIALTVTNEKLTLVIDENNVPTLVLDTAPTASGGSNDMVHISGDDAGMYDLELAAADTNHLGRGILSLTDANNHCPVFHEVMILPQKVYDSIVLGTDNLEIDAVQLLGTAFATPATAGLMDVNTKQQGGVTQTGRDLGASVLVGDKTGFALSSAGVNSIWDQLMSAISTTGSVGKLLKDYLTGDSFVRLGAPAGASHAADVAAVKADSAAIKLQTDKMAFTVANKIDCNALYWNGHAVLEAVNGSPVVTLGATQAAYAPAKAGDAMALTAAAIDAAWDEILSGHVGAGSVGKAITDILAFGAPPTGAAIADAICDEVISTGHTVANSLGKIIYDNVNAPIATVDMVVDAIQAKTVNLPASPAAVGSKMDIADSPSSTGVAVIVAAIWDKLTSGITTSGSIGKLIKDYLDAAISTRLASASYTAPPTAVQNRQEMDSNSTKLANLDAAVTTRAPGSTALSTSVWTSGRAALLDFLDALISSRLATSGYTTPPTKDQIADQVWDEAMSGHTATGSAGKALSNATAPSVSEIDAQLSGNHGAGAWGASAVGTIAYPDPEDPFLENGNPMVGVKVEAFSNSARTALALVDVQITDVNGNFQFHLNAGEYWFRASLAGHSSYEWSVVLE